MNPCVQILSGLDFLFQAPSAIKGGPQASTVNIIQKLVRNTESQQVCSHTGGLRYKEHQNKNRDFNKIPRSVSFMMSLRSKGQIWVQESKYWDSHLAPPAEPS